MKIEGWESGYPDAAPNICEHIKNICNQLIVNGCQVVANGQPVEIKCDKCRKVLGGRHIIP